MSHKLVIICGLCCLLFPSATYAQLKQARADYRQPTTYSPDDPNFRSRLFLEHTGHSGKFYNCDGEEDKRYSPYIYWSTVCNKENIRTWGNALRCDLREVKQRIAWGACREYCPDCNCSSESSADYLSSPKQVQEYYEMSDVTPTAKTPTVAEVPTKESKSKIGGKMLPTTKSTRTATKQDASSRNR